MYTGSISKGEASVMSFPLISARWPKITSGCGKNPSGGITSRPVANINRPFNRLASAKREIYEFKHA